MHALAGVPAESMWRCKLRAIFAVVSRVCIRAPARIEVLLTGVSCKLLLQHQPKTTTVPADSAHGWPLSTAIGHNGGSFVMVGNSMAGFGCMQKQLLSYAAQRTCRWVGVLQERCSGRHRPSVQADFATNQYPGGLLHMTRGLSVVPLYHAHRKQRICKILYHTCKHCSSAGRAEGT